MQGEARGTTETGEEFVPHGAIAFFLAMLGFYAVLWLVLFSVMAGRA